ncbi:MAG: AAA family ATPase [Candidatus Lokiarchaeota archaeon]|nr:AAA family ATPase [Candidatus Lokiarchaeota archaeon]
MKIPDKKGKIIGIKEEKPWVEKYRPNSFEEVVSQSIAINTLKEFALSNDMPHMIFAGPAGTGKTSTALIVAKNVINKRNYYANVLELNASDTVRMDYVRNVIKSFVNQNLMLNDNTLKFVILDEADNIPTQVQQALRRIIEKASSNVKFILLCNYINKIIDPIVSRCAVFRFTNLTKEKIVERLRFIINKEKLQIPQTRENKFYNTLFFISGGDLRKAINTLQMSVSLELIDKLDSNEILKISGFLDDRTLEELMDAINAKNIHEVKNLFDTIENLDSRNFIRQILERIVDLNIQSDDYNNLIAFIGDVDYRISQGADDKIQLLALIGQLIRYISS